MLQSVKSNRVGSKKGDHKKYINNKRQDKKLTERTKMAKWRKEIVILGFCFAFQKNTKYDKFKLSL